MVKKMSLLIENVQMDECVAIGINKIRLDCICQKLEVTFVETPQRWLSHVIDDRNCTITKEQFDISCAKITKGR